ncbi:FBD-associated F-box protein At2g26860-like [Oryza brachyantha]|uniref:FBD-associated F-box protein At2g26860-like n=1 Tax=Oryza brachyantha TaxID=4533 RepID=UPI001ADB6C3D|nr:FBD-associated F-box protein At2g26860-like [Oryza brachyantha]
MAVSGSSSPSSPKRRRLLAEEAPPPPSQEGTTDKLMSLPNEILDIILARVPFERLVRFGCLSRAWRRRWESVPELRVELPPRLSSARALWRCAAPVRSFRGRFSHLLGTTTSRWLRALARKRVQELTLQFENIPWLLLPKRDVVLGPAFFSCDSLVHLHLQNCRMPPSQSGFPGFPKLASLTLVDVALLFKGGGVQLQHLIAAAPDLVVLKLEDVVAQASADRFAVEEFVIRAPKLRNLSLTFFSLCEDNGCRIAQELPLLEEASISIDCLVGSFGPQDFLDIFRPIAAVNTLWFDAKATSCTVNPLEGITWRFENLRKASLRVTFCRLPSFMAIVSLLRCAPHIEDLDIETCDTKRSTNEVEIDEDFLNSEIQDDLISGLKCVSLSGAKYLSNQMCFMKFILSKAGSLQSFVVTFDYPERSRRYKKACKELAECQIASPQVIVRQNFTDDKIQQQMCQQRMMTLK